MGDPNKTLEGADQWDWEKGGNDLTLEKRGSWERWDNNSWEEIVWKTQDRAQDVLKNKYRSIEPERLFRMLDIGKEKDFESRINHVLENPSPDDEKEFNQKSIWYLFL